MAAVKLMVMYPTPKDVQGFERLYQDEHVPMAVKKLAGKTKLGATMVACGSRGEERSFLAKRVPVARLDSVLRAADSVRLPLADTRALIGVVAESGFAARAPHDSMTVAEILIWARAEQARKHQADAAASAAGLAPPDSGTRRR